MTADERWNRLYAWLGEQVTSLRAEGADNELCANLDESVGPDYQADAFVEARRKMRRMDESLVKDPEVDKS